MTLHLVEHNSDPSLGGQTDIDRSERVVTILPSRSSNDLDRRTDLLGYGCPDIDFDPGRFDRHDE
jgi:hypothetical protein